MPSGDGRMCKKLSSITHIDEFMFENIPPTTTLDSFNFPLLNPEIEPNQNPET